MEGESLGEMCKKTSVQKNGTKDDCLCPSSSRHLTFTSIALIILPFLVRDARSGTLLWKLDNFLEFVSPENHPIRLYIDFTLRPVPGRFQPGTISLHCLELHPLGTKDWAAGTLLLTVNKQMSSYKTTHSFWSPIDAVVRVHSPHWKWSVDLKINNDRGNIQSYVISEGGDYLATFGPTHLEIWDLDNMTQETLNQQQPATDQRSRSVKPRARSDPIVAHSGTAPWLSVSWDGNQVTLYDDDQPLNVFDIDLKIVSPPGQPAKIKRSANIGALTQEDLAGSATFHSGAKDQQHHASENERVLILTKDSVKIFSVQGPWRHIWTIYVNNLRSAPEGRLFLSRDDSDKSISVWNIDTGRVQCTIKTDRYVWDMMNTIVLSKDAAFLLETTKNSITSYCPTTGTRLAIKHRSGDIHPEGTSDGQFHTDKGCVLDGEDLTEMYRPREPGREATFVHMAKNGPSIEAIAKANSELYPTLEAESLQ